MAGSWARGTATTIGVLVAAMAVAGSSPARAAEPAATTFTADPDAGHIAVTVELTGDAISLPPHAADLVVTLDGRPAQPDVRSTATALGLGFPTEGRIRAEFTMPNEPDGPIKANAAYVWFPTWVWGPAGSSVQIRVPDDFQIKVDGAVLTTEQRDGWTVMSAAEVTDPAAWDVTVSARRDGALTTRIVAAGDLTYVIRSWPGADTWANRIQLVLDGALPALAEATGIDNPIGKPLVVAQSTDPARNGFDGWYVAATDTVEVGADPDVHVLVHEVSHAWFNDLLVDGRWLAEGLAETYTAMVEPALGRPAAAPQQPPTGLPPLAEWDHTALVDATTVDDERAAYAASWWVVDALVDDVGTDGMRAVLADLASERSAYAAPGFTTTDRAPDWQRLLDLLERHGATEAEEVLATWVVPESDLPLLDQRARVVQRYQALADDPLGWVPPIGVRVAMDGWDFDTAEERIDAAFANLAARDGLIADGTDVRSLRPIYESSLVLPLVDESTPEPAPIEDRGFVTMWVLFAVVALGLGGWLATRRRDRAIPLSDQPFDPVRLGEMGAQLELFALPTGPGDIEFTLIDLDVLAALDAELEDIDQPVLFELPPANGPIEFEPDPWARLGNGGTIRF
jgi:hypothetical protein